MDGAKVESRIYETPKTYDSVKSLCYEAAALNLMSVQVFPVMVSLCRKILEGSNVKINALIDYPHGGFLTDQKIEEAKEAVALGAQIVQIMGNTRAAKRGDFEYIYKEMRDIKNAVGENVIVKYIMEIEYLTNDEIKGVAQAAVDAKIDYLSTSSGLYHAIDDNKNDIPLVAKPSDIRLLKTLLEDKVGIQAEGYIYSRKIAEELIAAGADLISTEYAAAVMS